MHRRAAVALFLGFSAMTAVAQKQRVTDTVKPVNPADYTLTMHITRSRLVEVPDRYVVLDAVVDGKNIELEANVGALLHTGDYKARLVQDEEKKTGWFAKSYELLFSDGSHVNFMVVSESD